MPLTFFLALYRENFIKQSSSLNLTLKTQDVLAGFIFSFLFPVHLDSLKIGHQKSFKETPHERDRQGLLSHPNQCLQ